MKFEVFKHRLIELGLSEEQQHSVLSMVVEGFEVLAVPKSLQFDIGSLTIKSPAEGGDVPTTANFSIEGLPEGLEMQVVRARVPQFDATISDPVSVSLDIIPVTFDLGQLGKSK